MCDARAFFKSTNSLLRWSGADPQKQSFRTIARITAITHISNIEADQKRCAINAAPYQVFPQPWRGKESPGPSPQLRGLKWEEESTLSTLVENMKKPRILKFECPRTEGVVSTGIKVGDPVSYEGISYSTTFISCPHCPAPHRLSHVRSWLDDGNRLAPDDHQRQDPRKPAT